MSLRHNHQTDTLRSSMVSLAFQLPGPQDVSTISRPAAVSTNTQQSPSQPSSPTSLPSPLSDLSLQAMVERRIGDGPVTGEQVIAAMVIACTEIAVINNKLKDNGKFLRKVETIKYDFMAYRERIHKNESNQFVQRRLWDLFREATVLAEKAKRYQRISLTTAENKRKKLELRFFELQKSWSELVCNTQDVNDIDFDNINSAELLCIKGDKYLFGYGVNRCYDLAFRVYSKAVTKFGCAEAMNMMASMYEYGLGVESDQEKANKLYKDAAEKGNSDAMNNLGRVYELGKSMYGKDPMKAAQFYLKAAEGGNPDAMTNLGYLIENAFGSSITAGKLTTNRATAAGIQGSISKAAEWYRLASEKYNYARAQNFLGSLYYTGKYGIKKDYPEALKWFHKSSAQGNAHALNNLGICFEEGLAVPRDYAKAKEFYQKASDSNHPSATNNLGFIYLLERNYTEALKTFHIAAALGSADALYNIGTVFESGVYHPNNQPDFQLALKYFTDSAAKHYAKAQLKLAEYYLTGKAGQRDSAKAVEWITAAAKAHNAEAQCRLGELYESGSEAVTQDYNEAKKWYEKAASQEYLPAFLKFARLFENGHGVERDVDKALKLYVDAEALGETAAREHIDRINREQMAN